MKCNFCGLDKDTIQGIEINICYDCFNIIKLNTAVEEQVLDNNIKSQKFKMKAFELAANLNEYIVGQEEAKRILAVAVCNHYKRIKMNADIQKSNILLVGPTGSGKTFIMETLARILNLPLVIADATTFTEVGYVGGDASDVLKKLYYAANKDIELAERGIIYVDEIDKIATKSEQVGKSINGTGVQQCFLKIMDGGDNSFSEKDSLGGTVEITMNTDNILFVFGGAFVDLEKIIESRLNVNQKKSIGFGMNSTSDIKKETNIIKDITQADLIKFGFIPEFVGRIPIIAPIEKLDKDALKEILTRPKGAITKQYTKLMKADGISIKFNDEAIEYIVEEADKKNLGARGLKGIMDKPMSILMFNAPMNKSLKKLVITKELLQNPNVKVEDLFKQNK